MKKTGYIFFCAILTLMSVSCIKTVVEDKNAKKMKGNFRDNALPKKHYKKLENYRLILYPVGNMSVITLDDKATVKLRLRNLDNKKVRINEWYIKTENNIILYYRPFDWNVKKFVAKNWEKVTPSIKDKGLRFELELMPKNSVLIAKNLDFLKDINLKKGEKKRFLMVAELNLNSIKLRSSMFSVEVKQK
jgi:hypothetical protein